MDKRARILVVEDIENARETWIDTLTRERFWAEGAANLKEALDALDRSTFDVVLVDIMLNGPNDASNRDGIEVLRRIKSSGEPTRAFVLSGADNDMPLVRNAILDFDAKDFLFKRDVTAKTEKALIAKLRAAARAAAKPMNWRGTVSGLVGEMDEATFVHRLQRGMQFTGGFDVLRKAIMDATSEVMPLLQPAHRSAAQFRGPNGEIFVGTYWSKGQGCAVEIVIYGRGSDHGEIRKEHGVGDDNCLYGRSKAGLSILIARTEAPRSSFEPSPTSPSKG